MTRQRLLLAAGAALGLIAALTGAFTFAPGIPEDAIAVVNGDPIPRALYQTTLEGLGRDKTQAITAEHRVHVLNRIVEENLLLQRGVEIGLLHSHSNVRKTLVTAMIQTVLAQHPPNQEPTESTLREFFAREAGYFTPPPKLRVAQVVISGAGAAERAERAVRALRAGQPLAQVRASVGHHAITELPSSPIPLNRLPNYLGASATARLSAMQSGEVSDPLPFDGGLRILFLLERQQQPIKPFHRVQVQVRNEFIRRRNEQALRDYLDWLSQRADIRYATDAPKP